MENIRKICDQKEFEVNHEKVEKYKFIKAMMGGQYVKQKELHDVSYIWDPVKEILKARQLEEIEKIVGFSKWGHYSLFKPSIAEVISSIPDDVIDEVHAFEITGEVEICDPCHQFEVTLYKKVNRWKN